MRRTLSLSLLALAGLAVAGAAFGSATARPSIHVQPRPVAPGGKVHVYGNAGSCSAGRLTVISAAFPGHAFGEGGLTGTVRANHTFSIHGRVRDNAKPGSYSVGARCGGGNLGVSAHVHVS